MDKADKMLESRSGLLRQVPPLAPDTEEEGGCEVTEYISLIPVTGKNIFEPSIQMHNRGIGAVGFVPEALGVSRKRSIYRKMARQAKEPSPCLFLPFVFPSPAAHSAIS